MSSSIDHRDGPRDECGVFGIYGPDYDVARLAYFALFALQHRGQESAGIATAARGGNILAIRDQGLVAQVFDENTLRSLEGEMAIVNAAGATVAGVLCAPAHDGYGKGDATMRPERVLRAGEHLWLSVRPEYVAIEPATPAADGVVPGASGPMNALTGRVTDVVYAGSLDRIHITLSDGTVVVAHRPPSRTRIAAGEQVRVVWPAERGVLVGE